MHEEKRKKPVYDILKRNNYTIDFKKVEKGGYKKRLYSLRPI